MRCEKCDWILSSCHLISPFADLLLYYKQVIFRAEHLFAEVLNAIRLLVEKRYGRQLNSSINVPEARRQISDLEGMLQKEKQEFEVCVNELDL